MSTFEVETTKIKVALADDHQLLVGGIELLLKEHPAIEIMITAYNGKELVEALKHQEVDIIMMDINMPEMDGVETIKVVKKEFPKINTLILSTLDDTKLIRKMLKLGAMGYVLKNTSREELVKAIETVNDGDYYFTPAIQRKVLAFPNERERKEKKSYKREGHHASLTNRELEILRLIAEEYTGPEIAERLFISINTVETHRKNMVQKLGVKNTIGLIKYAIKHNLIDNS